LTKILRYAKFLLLLSTVQIKKRKEGRTMPHDANGNYVTPGMKKILDSAAGRGGCATLIIGAVIATATIIGFIFL